MIGLFNNRAELDLIMATAKTGSFYLTETIVIPAASATATRVQGTIDLGAYVNVATGQALAIESVDIVVQHGGTFNQFGQNMFTANGVISTQLTDLNPGGAFVRADNQSLIASSSLNIDDTSNILSHQMDLYPDNFGPSALSEAFMCVNDSLYLVGGVDTAGVVGTGDLFVTARIKSRIVKLGQKDWVAIAIQATASDS